MKHISIIFSILMAIMSFGSCSYLDIIPDNVATLDHAFADETTAERYLFTCYAGLPKEHNGNTDPAMAGSYEFWQKDSYTEIDAPFKTPFRIKDGFQNSNNPYVDNYRGTNGGTPLYKTIRKCYIFQNNIDKVINISELNKQRWIAESKVIIAYCYFYLVRQYGPVPLITKEYSIDSSTDDIRLSRNTMDECVNFIVTTLDEAADHLPPVISNKSEELGRFTQPIALTLKAKTLLLAASPLFNGNAYLADWTNPDGKALLSQYDESKWEKAREAAKIAINACHEAGIKLYKYESSSIAKPRRMDLTLRGAVTNRDWTDELIWGNVQANTHNLQTGSIVNFLGVTEAAGGGVIYPNFCVTLNTAKRFYTANGLPMEEDPAWANKKITDLRLPTAEEIDYVAPNEMQAEFNLQREPRYYSAISFNRAKRYSNGNNGDNFHIVRGYKGESANKQGYSSGWGDKTGMKAMKLVNPETTLTGSAQTSTFNYVPYPFPLLRLADLYLMYAEAANEAGDPDGDAIHYIDLVRERAGLKGVVESWNNSTNPNKPTTKDGLRLIIQQERDIELAFEGHNFWDIRRWLKLESVNNQPITCWDTEGKTPETFYTETVRKRPNFKKKDYLWPIAQESMVKNPALVQTKGW